MSNFDEDMETVTGTGSISITMPQFKNWGIDRFYDYDSQIVDYESIDELNDSIKAARVALFKTTDLINKYERKESEAKAKYDREWRRAYLQSSERTENAKKNRADLVCERFEDELIVSAQVKSELNRLSNAVRLELQTLQSLGNNLRQQLKMD